MAHDGSRYPLPWLSETVLRARRTFGAGAWRYGLAANRRTLEAFVGFAWEQQAVSRRLDVAELFLPFESE